LANSPDLSTLPLDDIPTAIGTLVARLIRESARADPSDGHPSPLVDAAGMAAHLRAPVSWVRDAQRRGKIPHIKLGGKYIRFCIADVDAKLRETTGARK
jgi:hypothetical protein